MTFNDFIDHCMQRDMQLSLSFYAICKERLVSLEDVFGAGKTASLVRARVECWHFMRNRGSSYPEIGDLWGRHHTTIMHALKTYPQESVGQRLALLEDRVEKLEARFSMLTPEERAALERRLGIKPRF